MVLSRSSKILMGLGIAFILIAVTVRFVVVPALSKLPSSLDVTAQYVGTGTLMNPEALTAGDYQNAVMSGVPVTVDRHVYVSQTEGDSAIAHDDFTVSAPGGVKLPTNHAYVLDRKTLDAGEAIEGTETEPHSGMTISLPLSPEAADYSLYDFATRSTVPLIYVDSGVVSGREVLNYRAEATGPLLDSAILSALPPALPKAQLAGLAPLLPADLQSELAPILPSLPDPVPFEYTAVSTIGLSADSTLGTPIDGTLDQKVIANIAVDGRTISLLPVLALDTALSDQSVSDAADAAATQSRLLNLISTIAPLALLLIGVLLIAAGLVRRRPTTTPLAERVTSASSV